MNERARFTAVLAATTAAIVAVMWIAIPRRQDGGRLIAELIEAAPRDHRLVAPRLAGFPAARWPAPPRGPAEPPDLAALQFGGVIGEVLEKTSERSAPDALHARGVALVLLGRASDSIAALRDAARQSEDARTWNDLAAARYVLAQNERPEELPQALAETRRALELDPALAEAHFNRALILDALQLRGPARNAWQQYLTIERGGEWSNEARERMKRDAPKAPAPDPQKTREDAEGPLFLKWAKAETAKSADAAELLARLRETGDALRQTNGEHLLADAVAVIDRGDAAKRAAIAGAVQIYVDGWAKLNRRRPSEAEPQLRRAAALFARETSPLEQFASFRAAVAAFQQNRTAEADDELERLLANIDVSRHRALAAQIHQDLAVHANAAGDWGTAVRHADAAAAIFRALGETRSAAVVDGISAIALEMIGDANGAWMRRLRTFDALETNPAYLGTYVGSASVTLAATGREAAAAAMLDVRIELAPPNDDFVLSIAHADAAHLAAQPRDAERALARARAHAARVGDPQLRNISDAKIELAGATSLEALDRSIDFFLRSRNRLYLPDAFLRRARLHRAAGNDAAAADYAAGLREAESQLTTFREGLDRLQSLDTAARLIEDMIEFHLTRGDTPAALEIADRGRTMFDTTHSDAPVDARALHVPAHVALVEYAVLPREVVAFCITSAGLSAERIAIERGELASRIDSFVERIRRRDPLPRVHGEAESLHRLLLGPLQQRLAHVTELVIVPDRQLHALPFAALRNATTKKYLVEELTIRIAPSASSRGDGTGPLAPALVVADPPAPPWPSLPASRDEAENIAALHRATLLVGKDSTREAFVARARSSALIHFSGHANSDASTSYGALLLTGESGVMGSTDIAAMRLEKEPLVVLAACGTFRGDAEHVGGMSSLSRAFLTAGARGVVGTLWEIDDDVAAVFFRALHRHLHDGDAPAVALRHTQRDLASSPDARLAHPATWAPIELIAR